MPTQVSCPSCSQTLRVPDDLAGRDVKCPKCGTAFLAASAENAPAQPRESTRSSEEGFREGRESPYSPAREAGEPGRPARPPLPELDDDLDDDDEYLPRHRQRYLPAHRGGMILAFGIISVVGMLICGPLALFGIPAMIMGMIDLRAMREERLDPSGRGMTVAGMVMGMIATALLAIAIVVVVLVLAFGN